MVLRSLSIALFVFTIGMPVANGPANCSPVWQEEIVAPGAAFSHLTPPSLALDPDGHPHLGYGHNRLFHTGYDGVLRHAEAVDSAGAWFNEFAPATGASGRIFIADIRGGPGFAQAQEPGDTWGASPIWLPRSGYSWFLSPILDGGWPHVVCLTRLCAKAVLVDSRQTPAGGEREPDFAGKPVDGPFSIDPDTAEPNAQAPVPILFGVAVADPEPALLSSKHAANYCRLASTGKATNCLGQTG